MAKKNNDSPYFKDWTIKKLKDEARGYHEMIYGEHWCYGTSDLRMYDGLLAELDRRGVRLSTELSFN